MYKFWMDLLFRYNCLVKMSCSDDDDAKLLGQASDTLSFNINYSHLNTERTNKYIDHRIYYT